MKYRGVVQKGERRGSVLGFPTANIAQTGPESGIYAAVVTHDGHIYHAAAYADQARKVLEVHLDGYAGGDLYDEDIEIELLQKIREDQEFVDEASLREAIEADVRAVQDYFRSSHTN